MKQAKASLNGSVYRAARRHLIIAALRSIAKARSNAPRERRLLGGQEQHGVQTVVVGERLLPLALSESRADARRVDCRSPSLARDVYKPRSPACRGASSL
eukprot:CAMPEP_0170147548 /NCGR_PEP_ID=MMETSP0033_2-20121228/34939_1 /TAXON_ID=195969 /ORGANISM="Dolichomastix tenuilepis, Strain CCMP3274" /LENGTH=99 /DNA_ID=CAMNT_0010384377 /DNA_START=316 /DNA_END=613 /DNA_ORIENTATION=-